MCFGFLILLLFLFDSRRFFHPVCVDPFPTGQTTITLDPEHEYVVDCLAAVCILSATNHPFCWGSSRLFEKRAPTSTRPKSLLRTIVLGLEEVQRHDQGKVPGSRARLSKACCVMTYGRVWWRTRGYIICRCDWQATTTEASATAVIDQRLEYELMTDCTSYGPRSCALIGGLVQRLWNLPSIQNTRSYSSKLFCPRLKGHVFWTLDILGHY